ADGAQRAAVPGCDVVEEVGELQAAGALEVLRHDRRIARDVLAEVACDHAGIEIVGAADAVADVKLNVAALVERRRGLREGRQRCDHAERQEDAGGCAGSKLTTHLVAPWTRPYCL